MAKWWHDSVQQAARFAGTPCKHERQVTVAARWGEKKRQHALNVAAGWILLLGLGGAALLYHWPVNEPTAAELAAGATADSAVAGSSGYALPQGASKQYYSDLQNIGGEAAVLSENVHWWLGNLWHGRALAITLALLAGAAALACLVAARWLDRRGSEGASDPA